MADFGAQHTRDLEPLHLIPVAVQHQHTHDLESTEAEPVPIPQQTFLFLPEDAPDTTGPVISNFSPAIGSTISAQQPITFHVTDNSGAFRRIMVTAIYPRTGVEEVVHDGENYVGLYFTASIRSAIEDGFSYSLMRSGGWPSQPTLRVWAVDIAGNEATQ